MSERILIVDDDRRILKTFSRHLRLAGYQVLTAPGGAEAIELFPQELPEIVFLDVRMPPPDGFAVLRVIQEHAPETEVILITGHGDMDVAIEALRTGASDFIPKPIASDTLEAALHRSRERLHLKRDLKEAQAKLAEYAADLEIRNADLDAYAQTVAHDLKTPLELVIGYGQLLKEYYGGMPEELQKYLNAIVRNSQRMNNIIEELLVLAEVHQIEIELVPLNMGRIVGEVQQRLAYMIEYNQAKIVLPTDWPVAIGYGPWVEEVWANYLSNAIEHGGRPPRLQLGATTGSDGTVRFWVRDNGEGITPEEKAQLFAPFTRFSQARTKGHGLGLSVVRRIIEKLKGQVAVESEVGAGSVFSFTLPKAEE